MAVLHDFRRVGEASQPAMFRIAWASRCRPSFSTWRPPAVISSRRLSEDAKQEIIQRLLSSKTITYLDELTRTKRDQLDATLHGFLPPVFTYTGHNNTKRRSLADRLAPGQHLTYFPNLTPTPYLLPDGTTSDHSPGDPWSQRLWAGGRIQFPQRAGLDYKEPHHVLAEYVRDVRITGLEGQEKIFVKIERRVGKLQPPVVKSQALAYAAKLKKRSEDFIAEALIVETRDLCFLRENNASGTFERRHITPPTEPEYSHTLIPTPALLFRYSALTFNAHAIHIDPEYTRNVYGLPNLLVQGPLTLTMMLAYMRRVLFTIPGMPQHWAPVITEINYRNLAPLFANEEMTICVKRKRDGKAAETTTSAATPSKDSSVDIKAGFQAPPSGEDDSVVIMLNKSPKSEGESSKEAGKGSNPQSDAEQKTQEWEIWIQTGKGDAASIAVRGTVKVEPFDTSKQLPRGDSKDASGKGAGKMEDAESRKDKTTNSGLTEEEAGILEKARNLLHEKQERLSPLTDSHWRSGGQPKATGAVGRKTLVAQATKPVQPPSIRKYKVKSIRRARENPVRKVTVTVEPLLRKIILEPKNPVQTSEAPEVLVRRTNEYPGHLHRRAIRKVPGNVVPGIRRLQSNYSGEYVLTAEKLIAEAKDLDLRSLEESSDPTNPAMGAFERTLRAMLEGK